MGALILTYTKCRLQSWNLAGYLQTNIAIEINCSLGMTEYWCKHHKIVDILFSLKNDPSYSRRDYTYIGLSTASPAGNRMAAGVLDEVDDVSGLF